MITGVQTGASTRVTGGLESTPNATFTIDFYADAGSSPINPGESIRFLDSVDVTTDATGLATFDVTLSVTTVADELVSATASDQFGNTSEFSDLNLVNVAPVDGLFTSENGGHATFEVSLAAQPTADVTIPRAAPTTVKGLPQRPH